MQMKYNQTKTKMKTKQNKNEIQTKMKRNKQKTKKKQKNKKTKKTKKQNNKTTTTKTKNKKQKHKQQHTKQHATPTTQQIGTQLRNSVPRSIKEGDIEPFLRELMKTSTPWYSLKLVLLGNGRVGKTTLLHKMLEHLNKVYFGEGEV
jgi:hypothetical protein